MKRRVYFEVEEILAKKITTEGPLYLVKWKGYNFSESTWEPLTSFKKSLELIIDFEKKFIINEEEFMKKE